MTWAEVKAGDVLLWTADDSELYLVLRREAYTGGDASERLWLLNLLDGEVLWWSMPHSSAQDIKVAGVVKVA